MIGLIISIALLYILLPVYLINKSKQEAKQKLNEAELMSVRKLLAKLFNGEKINNVDKGDIQHLRNKIGGLVRY